MSSLSPESGAPLSETETTPLLQRGHHRLALALVLLLHLLLLIAALVSRSRAPAPSHTGRSSEVVVYMPTPPEKKEAPPDPAPDEARLPPRPTPEMPKIEIVPDAIPAPPVSVTPAPVDAPPAPKPAAAAPPPAAPTPQPVVAESAASAKQLFAECTDTPNRKMVADVYQLSLNAKSVKGMDRRKPIRRVCMSQLDIPPSNFTQGFPGMEDLTGFFGLDIRFTVTIAQDTSRDIMLLCDDGGVLYVDDVLVIDNDGFHQSHPVMATVALSKGVHNFRVRYFQGPPPGLSLMLAWKKEGAPQAEYAYIPQRLIGRPPAELMAEMAADKAK